MVAKTNNQPRTSTLTSTPTSASVASTTKLEPSSSTAPSAPLSHTRCIRVPGLACQPVMEATKALAQRLSLRRRGSRWRDRKWSATKSTAGDTSAPASAPAPAPGAGDPPLTKATAPSPAPAPAATLTTTTTTTIPTKSAPVDVTTAESEKETASSPLQNDAAIPSPGSGISPTTIVTQPQPQSPKPTVHSEGLGKNPDERVTNSVTEIEYFPNVGTPDTHVEDQTAEDAQTSKITFAIPTKQSKEDESSQDVARQSDEIDTVTSSASPSSAVSPRESQDDYDEDAGRSSTLSGISGNGSRHSSINSVAFQLPNVSLPQGRTRRHKSSPPPLSR